MLTRTRHAATGMLVAGLCAACGNAVHDPEGAAGGMGGGGGTGGSGAATNDTECVLTKTSGDPTVNAPSSYVRMRFDPSERVISEESFGRADLRGLDQRRRTRLDEAGRVLAQTREDFTLDYAIRADGRFDAEENLVDWRASGAVGLDLSSTPPPPYDTWLRFTHTYDANGALSQTVAEVEGAFTGVFLKSHHEHDDLGRCSRITSSDDPTDPDAWQIVERSYDGDRPRAVDLTVLTGGTVRQGGLRYGYDSAGRLSRYEEDGTLGSTFVVYEKDGAPERSIGFEYGDDDSVTVDLLDFESGQNDDAVDRNGVVTPVAHTTWRLPPACARFLAALPRWTQTNCAAPGSPVPGLLELL